MTQTISAQKIRTNLGEIINQVYYSGLEFIVQRKGVPMVKISRFGTVDDGLSEIKNKYMRFAGILSKKNTTKMKKNLAKARINSSRKIKTL